MRPTRAAAYKFLKSQQKARTPAKFKTWKIARGALDVSFENIKVAAQVPRQAIKEAEGATTEVQAALHATRLDAGK